MARSKTKTNNIKVLDNSPSSSTLNKTASPKPTTKSRVKKPDQGARRKLISAGKNCFANHGLSGTSIRDIAKAANMNSSMISYYFGGKEGLYKECLKEIGEKRLAFAQDILKPPNSKEEFKVRLGMLIENLFTLFLEDRETGLIVVREYDRVHSPAEKIFKNTFLKIFDLTIDFFKVAQTNQMIPKDRDPFILASLFFGALSSQMRLDHIKNKAYKRSLHNIQEKNQTQEHLIQLFIK